MTPRMRLAAYLLLSVVLGYAINDNGYGIAHTPAASLVALAFAPGVLALLFVGPAVLAWAAFACLNCLYYEAIYRAVSLLRKLVRTRRPSE